MGTYDLPAMISYVTNLTSQPIQAYVGFSMGTTTSYVMAAKRPEIAEMIKVIISLSPVAFVGNTSTPLRGILPLAAVS